MSNALNEQLVVISLYFFSEGGLGFTFSALHMFGYGSKFIHIVQAGYINIQSKIKINSLLSNPFTLMGRVYRGCPLSMLSYISAAKVLAILTGASARIKGVQIAGHKMKISNSPDGTTIFLLRDINCNTRIKSILKLYEKTCISKISCSKIQALWAGAYKNRIDKP